MKSIVKKYSTYNLNFEKKIREREKNACVAWGSCLKLKKNLISLLHQNRPVLYLIYTQVTIVCQFHGKKQQYLNFQRIV